jgi:hypothetical protein
VNPFRAVRLSVGGREIRIVAALSLTRMEVDVVLDGAPPQRVKVSQVVGPPGMSLSAGEVLAELERRAGLVFGTAKETA